MKITIHLKIVVTLISVFVKNSCGGNSSVREMESFINWMNCSCLVDFKSKMIVLSAVFHSKVKKLHLVDGRRVHFCKSTSVLVRVWEGVPGVKPGSWWEP